VDFAETNPGNPDTRVPVADWVILDNASTRRGEYIGRTADAKVPVWVTEKEAYELALNTKNKRRRLPIDFTVRRGMGKDPAVLIDYSGGRQVFVDGPTRITDDTPVQLLVLTPDGKLTVRENQADIDNKERKERYDAWKAWIDDVEKGRAGNRNAPAGDNPFQKRGGGGGKGI
jgi:hypothetical protein